MASQLLRNVGVYKIHQSLNVRRRILTAAMTGELRVRRRLFSFGRHGAIVGEDQCGISAGGPRENGEHIFASIAGIGVMAVAATLFAGTDVGCGLQDVVENWFKSRKTCGRSAARQAKGRGARRLRPHIDRASSQS